jgi:hypothetical protein
MMRYLMRHVERAAGEVNLMFDFPMWERATEGMLKCHGNPITIY